MSDSNPYARPITESASADDIRRLPPVSNWYYIVPAVFGAAIGGFLLAPSCRSFGDPGGHSTAAGLGGLIALFLAVFVRLIAWPRRR